MKINHYLKPDQQKATAEHCCSMDLLIRIADALYLDDLEEAQRSLRDLNKSIGELTRLKERKQNYDKLAEVAQKLANEGILVTVVRRLS
jgi:nitrate reductase assembly molybdenum cofactor insertion protein NarJ